MQAASFCLGVVRVRRGSTRPRASAANMSGDDRRALRVRPDLRNDWAREYADASGLVGLRPGATLVEWAPKRSGQEGKCRDRLGAPGIREPAPGAPSVRSSYGKTGHDWWTFLGLPPV